MCAKQRARVVSKPCSLPRLSASLLILILKKWGLGRCNTTTLPNRVFRQSQHDRDRVVFWTWTDFRCKMHLVESTGTQERLATTKCLEVGALLLRSRRCCRCREVDVDEAPMILLPRPLQIEAVVRRGSRR
ncbi:hypothetical protein EV126DRAFT_92285 [Verticillium dahliae]|nr:hypothetical protein EV126DRAFT_92285 [Verticillium dahliae]